MSAGSTVPIRILVIGAGGQLGRALAHAPRPDGMTLIGASRARVDLTRPDTIEAALGLDTPDVVINAAAYTAVDRCETDRDTAFRVNAVGPAHLAVACAGRNIALIHVSTDYVFDGRATRPYLPDDATGPLNVYGESKRAGEVAVCSALAAHALVRTSWVISPTGTNFVRTMLRLAAERDALRVVADQYGAPTAAADIATALLALAERLSHSTDARGTWHVTGGGETTWYGLAEAILADLEQRTRRRPTLTAITTAEFPTPARRPANSRLDCSRFDAAFPGLRRPWQHQLHDVLDRLHGSPS